MSTQIPRDRLGEENELTDKVTAKMIEAGVRAHGHYNLTYVSEEDMVVEVYRAMAQALREQRGS